MRVQTCTGLFIACFIFLFTFVIFILINRHSSVWLFYGFRFVTVDFWMRALDSLCHSWWMCEIVCFFLPNPSIMNMHILAWKLFMHVVNYYSFILMWKVEIRHHLWLCWKTGNVHDLVHHLTTCHTEEFTEHLHRLISRSRCVPSKSGCYFNGPSS